MIRDFYDLVEFDEEYPTEESLQKLKDYQFSWEALAEFYVNELPSLMEKMPCGSITIEDCTDVMQRPCKKIIVITGGWSGVESLIGVLIHTFPHNYFYSAWKRGGYHEFEVPCQHLSKTQA